MNSPSSKATTLAGRFMARPAIYACVVLVAAYAAFAYQIRNQTIFSCPAGGYSADQYLAYCQGEAYGDYEHGAFQFGLEPAVRSHVRDADVIFLGNSRLQFAFSTNATAEWFSAASARYYLMGFLYYENFIFEGELLQTIRPRARVFVINVDDFFDRSESPPVKTIFHDPEARHKYEIKQLWQRIHAPICGALARLCEAKFAIFRSRTTGAYYTEGDAQRRRAPVSYDTTVNRNVVDSNSAAALSSLARFAQDKCVILTDVPFVGTKIGNANAIAAAIGAKLVMPGPVEGLQTFDGYHLDRPSAEKWSRAFFAAAGQQIRSCLGDQEAIRPAAYQPVSRLPGG